MPVFTFQVEDSQRIRSNGTIAGESARQARGELREKGLKVLALDEVRPRTVRAASIWFYGRTSSSRVAAFMGELSTLLAVGVPLVEGLDTLVRQYRGRFRTCLMQLRDQLAGGTSLAAAMAEHPRTFDELCISLVEVGENTGRLDYALDCIAKYKRKSSELRDRVLNALLYPAIIFGISIFVSIFLMTVVVPMLLSNLVELGKTLPWPTRILQTISSFILNYKWLLLVGVGGAIIGVTMALRTMRGRRMWDAILLRIPLIGMMSRKQEISRLTLVISTLMASGLDFLKAIEIASRTSRNTLLRKSLETLGNQVRTGRELGPIMEQLEYFPPLVAHVFTVGQKSGQLEPMLLRLSQDYDQQVASLSQRLAVVIEPLLIIFLSVIVGFILFATLLPILEAGNVL